MMDILNLSQGALGGSGLPVHAEPIVGQMADGAATQTPAAFSDALLNVIGSLMAGQGKPTRDLAASDQPVSLEDGDKDSEDQTTGDALLKGDAQQQLLETLLMTSQTPTQAAQPTDETLMMTNAQPLMAAQTLSMRLAPTLQQNLTTPVTAATAETLPAAQPVSSTLMSALTPVTPMATQPLESSQSISPATPGAAPVTSTLKMDPEPSRWSEQLQSALGERLQVQVKQQIQHATIRLDPPDMGKIDISMQVDNGRVQVQINASHAEVYRALQQTSNDLRQSLTEQNFVQVNVQVSSQSGGQQQGRGQQFTEQHNAILAGAELAANATAAQDSRSDDSVLLTV